MAGPRPLAWIILLVALGAGIAVYLYLDWQGQQPVDAAQADEFAEAAQLNFDALQEALTEDIDGQPRTAAHERMESPTGQAFSRKCVEWTEFYENNPSDDARANRDQACTEYRNYVDSGELPETP